MRHWCIMIPVILCCWLLYYGIYMLHDPVVFVSNNVTPPLAEEYDVGLPPVKPKDRCDALYASMTMDYTNMLVNVGTYTPDTNITMRYDRISFCDANGKQVVLIHLDTGDIVHSYDNLDQAGQAAADIFWGAFGQRLKQKL